MNKKSFKKLMRGYGMFIGRYPFLILAAALLVTVVAANLQSQLEMVSQQQKDFLPENRPVVVAYEKIGDEFGGLNTLTVACEVEPTVAGSNEVRDSLDPRMISYAWELENKLLKLDEVLSVESAASLLRRSNQGSLPKSIKRARQLSSNNPVFSQYLSEDHTILLIKAEVLPDLDEDEMYEKINFILVETGRPPGVKSYMLGQIPQDVEIDQYLSGDMGRVMSLTMAGILVVVLVVMGNLAYGILPIFTIVFGTTWSMGMWAGLGQNLTANTSGVSSMIMGIGIDFGIQTINRFRQELAKAGKADLACGETLANVVLPMSTTTLAALIGFRAMSMGELSFLADMGSIMSLGVLGCFLAAVTIVPALMIIYVRYVQKLKIKEDLKKWMRR